MGNKRNKKKDYNSESRKCWKCGAVLPKGIMAPVENVEGTRTIHFCCGCVISIYALVI